MTKKELVDWAETHYIIVGLIAENNHLFEGVSQGDLWGLAFDLTNEFQEINKDREYDGGYFEEVEKFFKYKTEK